MLEFIRWMCLCSAMDCMHLFFVCTLLSSLVRCLHIRWSGIIGPKKKKTNCPQIIKIYHCHKGILTYWIVSWARIGKWSTNGTVRLYDMHILSSWLLYRSRLGGGGGTFFVIQHFLGSWFTGCGEGVSLMCGPHFTSQENSWYSFLFEAE
jgi:hypothetical protein